MGKIGVGGFVLNDRGEVLVIQERNAKHPHWKLPGGIADLGEDLAETAAREVKEETGVDAEFVRVVSFRHQHDTVFGRSDIYFVVQMKAKSLDIRMDGSELSECRWVTLPQYIEFLSQPNGSNMNRIIAQLIQTAIQDGSYLIDEIDLPVSKRSKGGKLYAVFGTEKETCQAAFPASNHDAKSKLFSVQPAVNGVGGLY